MKVLSAGAEKHFYLTHSTFDVVLGFAGGANLASVGCVELHLADVGAETAG